MKKTLLSSFLALFTISLASANEIASSLEYGMTRAIEIIEGFFGPLVFALIGGEGDMLFERVMIFAILISLIYLIISTIKIFEKDGEANNALIWIVTVSISLLATRFLTSAEIVLTIILPYSVLGVSLSAAIPFLIYYKFTESIGAGSSTTRKLMWVFYVVVFLGLWMSRYEELGSISWIYFISAGAGFFFLLFDGTIHKWIAKQENERLGVEKQAERVALLKEQIDKLDEKHGKGYYTDSVYKNLRKKKVNDLKRAERNKY